MVVTGLDVVTPIGVELDGFWKAALAGVSGVRRITHFDPEGLPTQIAAALDDPVLIEEFRAEAALDPLEPRGAPSPRRAPARRSPRRARASSSARAASGTTCVTSVISRTRAVRPASP